MHIKDEHDNGQFHFYQDPNVIPRDIDTSSFGCLLLLKKKLIKDSIVRDLCFKMS